MKRPLGTNLPLSFIVVAAIAFAETIAYFIISLFGGLQFYAPFPLLSLLPLQFMRCWRSLTCLSCVSGGSCSHLSPGYVYWRQAFMKSIRLM